MARRQRLTAVPSSGGGGDRRPCGILLCLLPFAVCCPLALGINPAYSVELAPPSSPWQVTADKIYRFVNPPSIIAEGNVVLVRQGVTSVKMISSPEEAVKPSAGGPKPLTITGDWVRLDPAANLVKVRGHAVLDSEEEHITADLVDLDMDKQIGHLQGATIYFPKRSLYLAGQEVQKTGELTYHLEDGWVTKCAPVEGHAPPWRFGWSQADITQEGFAHFSHATFQVKDVPVVYTPYVGFSTNTKRKTGLLLPELTGGSRDGAGFLAPFFVNLSPSQDITLYGGGMSERGPLAGVEYRYVQDVGSKGSLQLNALQDSLTDTTDDDFRSDGILRTTKNRYWLRGKADHDFGNNINAKLDLDLVSDQDYLQEYTDGLIGFKESNKTFVEDFGRGFDAKSTHARTNTAQLNKMWPTMTLGGEVRTFDDPTVVPSVSHPWSLPSVNFAGSKPLLPTASLAHGPLSWLAATDLTWDSGYVYYWREDGVGGQRADLHPVLKTPLRFLPYLETVAALGLRQTMYQAEDNDTTVTADNEGILSRTLSDASLSSSTIFMRDFNVNGSYLRTLSHMVRPGLTYSYIPATSNQDDLPSIDTSVDRISAKNLLTYELRNDFDVTGADGTSWKFGSVRLSQAYDIHEARRDLLLAGQQRQDFTDIDFESWLRPIPDLQLIYKTTWDVHDDGKNIYDVAASYATPRGDKLRVDHRYNSASSINQLNFNVRVHLIENWQAQAVVNHSMVTNETSDASLRLLYSPACWAMALQATTTPDDDYRFALLFSLEGVGNIMGLSQTFSSSGDSEVVTP